MTRIIIPLFFLSCAFPKEFNQSEIKNSNGKYLSFLKEYESAIDSMGGQIITKYEKLNLAKVSNNAKWSLMLRGRNVFSGDYNKYSYLMEVFNETYLLISCVEGISTSSGPDTFKRDSVIFLELNTGVLSTVCLERVNLTRSRSILFELYSCPSDTLKYKSEYNRYCAVDSIDTVTRKLILVNQCHQEERYDMLKW